VFGGWGPGWRIARVRGIDVVADASLLVLAGLIAWSLYLSFGAAFPRAGRGELSTVSLAGGVLFIGSVLVHELSHSLVAVRRGLPVRRIRLFLFGGVSEIEREAVRPRDEFTVAVVGPVSSLLLGAVFLALAEVLPADWQSVVRLFRLLAVVNVALGVFNLVPGFPLDGGRVLRAAVWGITGDRKRATRIAVRAGKVVALGLVVGGFVVLFSLGNLGGLWWVAIGWFLYQAALATVLQDRALEAATGVSVSEIMRATPRSVGGEVSVAEFVDTFVIGERFTPVPVVVAGRVRGLMGPAQLAVAPSGTMRVADAMDPLRPQEVVEAGAAVTDLFGRLDAKDDRLVVVEGGRVVGVVTAGDLARFLDRVV
jgi:Zn-dependent protease/predicted transcriptional regulator